MSEARNRAGRRILVVEDETLNALYVASVLEATGHQVICANTAEGALETAKEWLPDLVLMDITLRDSGSDGIEIARRLREQLRLPIVFATAHADAATHARAQLTNPVGYLIKPFTSKELLEAVERALAIGLPVEAVA